MKNTQVHPNLVTVTRQDLIAGYQIAQSCHSVADFAYHLPTFFNNWRTNSNYKVCLAAKDEQSLEKLYLKLKERGASVIAFREPDLGDELTAITLYGEEEYKKYTKYLPLAGKNNGATVVETNSLKVKSEGSTPSSPTNIFITNK